MAGNTNTVGGWNIGRVLGTDTLGSVVQAGPTLLGGWFLSNSDSVGCFLKFYDKATAPTDADTPKLTINLPAASGANAMMDSGIVFTAGLSVRATSGFADNDTGDVASNSVLVNLLIR